MNDRELLKMAAKAVGYVEVADGLYCVRDNYLNAFRWNPLTDDGDALRLANHLGLTIGQSYEAAYVDLCSGEILQKMEHGCQFEVRWNECGADKNLACRLAITRAAAAIGQSMP